MFFIIILAKIQNFAITPCGQGSGQTGLIRGCGAVEWGLLGARPGRKTRVWFDPAGPLLGSHSVHILAHMQNAPCTGFPPQRYVIGKKIGDNLDIHKHGIS